MHIQITYPLNIPKIKPKVLSTEPRPDQVTALPIALPISLAYDEAMKLAWLDLVLLTLVFAVLTYVFFT